jgi:hypothetical protein
MKDISRYVALAAFGISLAAVPVGIAQGAETPVKYHGIAAQNVKKEVPEAVRKIMDENTKDAKDLFYQRQERDGKTYYTVHYTKADKRMFVRVSDKGKLVVGPLEAFSTVRNEANPDFGKDPSKVVGKREKITREQLPEAVRKTVEETTANGKSYGFLKQTRGDEVSYVVDWTIDGDDTTERIGADGKVIEPSPLATGGAKAPETAAQAPAPPQASAPTPAPAPAAPAGPTEAELAAARDTAAREAALAAAPYQLLSSAAQLPVEVRSAIEKSAKAGSTDLLLQRFKDGAQNLYSVHYTEDGKRMFMAVDQAGKVVIEPRVSKAQQGAKGVRFEAITGDKLPPEVQKTVEANGGSEHLLLARTAPNGEKSYFVQYTGPKGERLETEINANGKERGKPRAAREQPITILKRKGD